MMRTIFSFIIVIAAGCFVYAYMLPTSRPNISYLLESTRTDPLFALAGTDLDRMDLAVNTLVETQQKFASIQSSTRDIRLIANLYPISFLKRISMLERQRRQFLNVGSERDADRYLMELRATIRAYRNDLRAFEAAFHKAVPEDLPPYELADGRVSRESLLSAVERLLAESATAEQEVNRRDACSRSAESKACAEDGGWRRTAKDEMPADPLISAADIAITRSLAESIEERLGKQLRPIEKGIPLIAISDATCTTAYPRPVLFGTRIEQGFAFSYPRLTIAGNRRMVDATEHQNVPFYKFFLDRGVRYVPTSGMLHYQCSGYARDLGTHQTILDLLDAGMPTAIPGVATDRDAARFVEDTTDTELRVAWYNRSGSYENLLLSVAIAEQGNASLTAYGADVGLSVPFLFYARNAFGVVFMTANASVAHEVGSILDGMNPQDLKTPYVYYRALSPAERLEADRGFAYYLSLHGYVEEPL